MLITGLKQNIKERLPLYLSLSSSYSAQFFRKNCFAQDAAICRSFSHKSRLTITLILATTSQRQSASITSIAASLGLRDSGRRCLPTANHRPKHPREATHSPGQLSLGYSGPTASKSLPLTVLAAYAGIYALLDGISDRPSGVT